MQMSFSPILFMVIGLPLTKMVSSHVLFDLVTMQLALFSIYQSNTLNKNLLWLGEVLGFPLCLFWLCGQLYSVVPFCHCVKTVIRDSILSFVRNSGWNPFGLKSVTSVISVERLAALKSLPLSSWRDVKISKNWNFSGELLLVSECLLCARHCMLGWLLLKRFRKGIFSFRTGIWLHLLSFWSMCTCNMNDGEKLEPPWLVTYLVATRFRTRT